MLIGNSCRRYWFTNAHLIGEGWADKVTIRAGFSGRVLIFSDVSLKKIAVLPGRPFVQFLVWCPGFVPALLEPESEWLNSSLNSSLAPGLCPGPRWGSTRRSPRHPSWIPDGSRMWRSHPTTGTCGGRTGLRCPSCGHLTGM